MVIFSRFIGNVSSLLLFLAIAWQDSDESLEIKTKLPDIIFNNCMAFFALQFHHISGFYITIWAEEKGFS